VVARSAEAKDALRRFPKLFLTKSPSGSSGQPAPQFIFVAKNIFIFASMLTEEVVWRGETPLKVVLWSVAQALDDNFHK
jgi:hypothetical protein